MLIQLIILLFIAFVLSRMFKKLKKKELTKREFIWWFIFWIIVGIVTISPKLADLVAKYLGVESGSNLAVYISILVLFYLIFRMMVKIDKLDRDITKIVRNVAINEAEKGGKREEFPPFSKGG